MPEASNDAVHTRSIEVRTLLMLAAVVLLAVSVVNWYGQTLRILLATTAWIAVLATLHRSTRISMFVPQAVIMAGRIGIALFGFILFIVEAGANMDPAWGPRVFVVILSAVLVVASIATVATGSAVRVGWALMLCAFALVLVSVVWSTHEQKIGIDVGVFQVEAVDAFLDGESPYSITYDDPYPPGKSAEFYGDDVSVDGELQFGYPYMPLSLLVIVPFEILGDFRIAFVVCFILTAVLIGSLGNRDRAVRTSMLFMLFAPAAHMVRYGWNDPIVMALMALTVWGFARESKGAQWFGGLAATSKQYAALFAATSVPGLGPFSVRRTAAYAVRVCVVLAVTTLPWVIWDPEGFYRSVIELQFKQPFREDSIALPALVPDLYLSLPRAVVVIVPLVVVGGMALWLAVRGPRGPQAVAMASAIVFFTGFILAKQAFVNYYTPVLALLCLALVAPSADQPESSSSSDQSRTALADG